MRKSMLLLGTILLAGLMPACSAQNGQEAAAPAVQAAQPAAPVELKTQKEKVSYILGLSFGRNFQQQSVDVDADMMARGIRDAAPGSTALMTDEEMQATMQAFEQEMMEKQQALTQALTEKNKKAGAEFLAKNAKEPGVQTTASGLQYKVIKEGTGASPKATDTVKVIYSGKLLDGKDFGSSDGEAVEVPLDEVQLPGWVEGMQLMKVGGQATMWIPGDLGFQSFAPPGIEPYSMLIMDVTLVEIMEAPAVEDAAKGPEDAEAPVEPE